MQHCWHITLFGELTAQQGTARVAQFDTRQTAGLLAYLAFYRHRTHSRELLADRLWPEEDSIATRGRLRTTLWALRRVLEPEGALPGSVLIADRTEVRLAPEALATDVEQFEHAVRKANQMNEPAAQADALCHAADLYTGELLTGWYDDWVLAERNTLAETFRATVQRATEALAELGDVARAIDYARRVVSADPHQEEAHTNLIKLYLRAGHQVTALRQYRDLERRLAELGLRPSSETRALFSHMNGPVSKTPSASLPPAASATPLKASAPVPEPPEDTPLPAPAVTMPNSLPSPPIGAMHPASPHYIWREIDDQFTSAVARQDSIVLIKGARQVGKTSLLARGLQQARLAGTRVILTDFRKLTAGQMETSDSLFLTLARDIAEQLDLDLNVDEVWHSAWGWNVNFERLLRREALKPDSPPVVWGLDEVDLLFGRPDSDDIFALFRSWHNARSLNPDGPWSRLTLAIAYATEAYLFIKDLNQSPFNVGTRLVMSDFTPEEVAELNRRYRSPLHSEAELARYIALVGGHPYLVHQGIYALTAGRLDLVTLVAQAIREDGLFGGHLRHLRLALQKDAGLYAALSAVLRGEPCPTNEAFFRLQSAGVLVGESNQDAALRCGLYRSYLGNHL
jgi:DNA-binding SARP family transcriptional activator